MARSFGQVLVDLGYIDEEQLELLREEQSQRAGELIGQIAIGMNMLTEDQLAQALGEQLGLQVVAPTVKQPFKSGNDTTYPPSSASKTSSIR